jgi:hypothetical protein
MTFFSKGVNTEKVLRSYKLSNPELCHHAIKEKLTKMVKKAEPRFPREPAGA